MPQRQINREAKTNGLYDGSLRESGVTRCEMGEQTGSASETKHPLLSTQGSGRINSFAAALYKITRSF
jgi:hypothetical protein